MKEEIVQSQMNHLSLNDSTTELNTKLNESLVIMDSSGNSDFVLEKKVRKSITLKLEAQPPTPSSSKSLNASETLKGILKKPDNNIVHETGREYYQKIQDNCLIAEPRPHNLEELIKSDGLLPTTIQSTFSLENLSADDEIWLMEIPKSINPKLLNGQVLSLTDKSKLKIGEDRYTTTLRDIKGTLSCVLSTEKDSASYKAVNIKPAGIIQVRQKLTAIPKTKPKYVEKAKVPLPQNIRHRDPLLGVVTDVTHIKIENESRKYR